MAKCQFRGGQPMDTHLSSPLLEWQRLKQGEELTKAQKSHICQCACSQPNSEITIYFRVKIKSVNWKKNGDVNFPLSLVLRKPYFIFSSLLCCRAFLSITSVWCWGGYSGLEWDLYCLTGEWRRDPSPPGSALSSLYRFRRICRECGVGVELNGKFRLQTYDIHDKHTCICGRSGLRVIE